jgi:hypothetical protein
MTQPQRARGGRQIPLQVNDTLTHPMASNSDGQTRSRWKYRYLRTTRPPISGRPDSGRILVQNEKTGDRREFYAILFGVTFKG